MKIGIDIDNVISNFNDTIVEAYLQHDKQLRNTGIINDKAKVFRRGIFDWSEEEEKDFYYSNIEKWANAFKPINNAEYYIKKLKQDGNEIYIISGRENGEYRNPYKLTKEWLEKYDIIYDKLILTNAYKKHEKAVRTVFESKAKLTIIPCKNVASNLMTSIYEVEHFLKGKSELCDYLCQRFYNDGIHGVKERRVIWDISVIAYMINKKWFETEEISCPNIKDDTSYELAESNHKIRVVNYLNVDKIYKDLFEKLGRN